MAFPIIIVVAVPIFLGLVYVSPVELSEEEPINTVQEPNLDIFYFVLFAVWIAFLIRILIQVKRRQFRIAQKY
ncbi:MAG: hypothetical protein HKM23_03145 [Nitrosopumilus sp.]|nr:hypothetical protein [Nitrosopumilus sp.]